MSSRTFLTAEWRHLAMLNYRIDPGVLAPMVPRGTELDLFAGECFVSVVGFCFLHTRVFGWSLPFHRDFEEVNLRFYVRRPVAEGWRRGVVFVRELVPRRAIALVARTCYGEPYSALPMRHSIEETKAELDVRYEWLRRGVWESIRAASRMPPEEIEPGSLAEFITEHYWGYTSRGSRCSEYQVEHPRWRVRPATECSFEAQVESLYGAAFCECLATRPASAFIAEGSAVSVRRAADFQGPVRLASASQP